MNGNDVMLFIIEVSNTSVLTVHSAPEGPTLNLGSDSLLATRMQGLF